VANGKRLALFLAGVAYQKFGDKLIDEQEIVSALSDIIIDTFLAESALLRTIKARNRGGKSSAMADLTLIIVNGAVERMDIRAKGALAATSEGDDLRGQLGMVRRLMRWLPLNAVALRRRVATRLCEVGSFPALLGA